MGMNTHLHTKDSNDTLNNGGTKWTPVESNNGSIRVSDIGVPAQSHNRFVTVDGPTLPTNIQSATWTEAEGVYAVRIKVVPNTGAAGEVVRVVFDASPVDDTSDTTQASNWLAVATENESADVEYYELISGGIVGTNTAYIDPWSRVFYFDAPLRRADFITEAGGGTHDITIEVA